ARVEITTSALTGRVGDTLPEPVVVRVTDSLGRALADLPVAWSSLDGGAISAQAMRTDSLGEARATWKLGTKAGRQRARVQVGNARTMPPGGLMRVRDAPAGPRRPAAPASDRPARDRPTRESRGGCGSAAASCRRTARGQRAL